MEPPLLVQGINNLTSPLFMNLLLISPGVTESELAESITDDEARELMRTYRREALPASAIANAIAYAIEQPAGVDVNDLVVRPAAQLIG